MRSKGILMIVYIMLIGCDNANGGGSESTTPDMKISNVTEIEKAHDNTTEWTYVEMDLDDMDFGEAFRIQHKAKGEGHIFWWRGEKYTTNIDYDVVVPDNGHHGWVRNSDDLDDSCRSNEWDECGICNGTGPVTWYRDHDQDGLGDPAWSTKDCFYPSVDEE